MQLQQICKIILIFNRESKVQNAKYPDFWSL
jgi:hypothetical protein